jgi:hypothetical protein
MKHSMKKKIMTNLACCVLFTATMQVYSQTTVQVDSTKVWVGWMNIYDNNGGSQGGYLWGNGWGIADLRAGFVGTNYIWIGPNTNVWNPSDPYWVTNTVPPSGAKWMEANFYVDAGAAYAGQTVKFVGHVLTNTLVSPYVSQAFIKEFTSGYGYVGMTTVDLSEGSDFTVERNIAAGNICQYGFITTGPDADPSTAPSLGTVAVAVNNADPTIASGMNGLALVAGQDATFTVMAQGTAPLHYQWAHITPTTTNVLSDGGRISGATTNSLTITSVIPSDAGNYSVTVTNSKGTNFAVATLAVVPLAQAETNYLIDPGFELGYFASSGDAGWFDFSGSAIQSTNNTYVGQDDPPIYVRVVDGTNCCQLYGAGTWNGVFQDRPASPGEIFTADAWALTPELDYIGGGNSCYLEVQFRTAADVVLRQYSSGMVDYYSPTLTWIHLMPTNIYDGTFTNYLGTSDYLVAPPGTAKVRYQFTYHAVGGYGSVYVDAATLILRAPAVTASPNGASVDLSFSTLYGPQYQVYYKTDLTETTWHTLGSPVTGDGTVKTVSDSTDAGYRFYIVNTVQ